MFRDFACRNARSLKLVGEVQNLPDGTVSVIAEGPRASLDRYVDILWKGSLLSKVEQVHTTFGESTGEYQSFEITF